MTGLNMSPVLPIASYVGLAASYHSCQEPTKKFSQKFQIVTISPGSTSRLRIIIINSSAANTLSDANYSGISSPILSSHDDDDIPIDPSLVNDFIKIYESTTQPSNSPNFR